MKLRAAPDSDLVLLEASVTIDETGRRRVRLTGPFDGSSLNRLIWMVDTRAEIYRIIKLRHPERDALRIAKHYREAGREISPVAIAEYLRKESTRDDEEAKRFRESQPAKESHAPRQDNDARPRVDLAPDTPFADTPTAEADSGETTYYEDNAVSEVQEPTYCDGYGYSSVQVWEPARYVFNVTHLAETYHSATWRVYPGSSINYDVFSYCWSNPQTFIYTSWYTVDCIGSGSKYTDTFDSATTGTYVNVDFYQNNAAVFVVATASVGYTFGTPIWGAYYEDINGGTYNWYEDILLTGKVVGLAEQTSCAYPAQQAECEAANGYWDGELCFYSPLLVDVLGNQFALTDAAQGVRFDANADGVADKVAWTAADSDDSWLALDRNGNGVIDDGSELFGNYTEGAAGTTAGNGFEALRVFDTNQDGVIDNQDEVFGRLLLWRDANHNGVSEPGELSTVGSAGVLAIYTDYKTAQRRDRYGNLFGQRARIVWNTRDAWIFDVWLRHQ